MEPAAKNNFNNRIALVSGGSSGIGKAITSTFSAQNATVFNADIKAPEPNSKGNFISCDITQASEIDRLFQQLHGQNSLPDILVCNAGKGITEKLTEGDPEKWRKVFDLNVLGALRLIRAFVPPMLEKGFGDVVFISSVAAGKAFTYGGIYAATKSALETIAETLRLEVLPTVRVFTVAPGVTDTGFFENTVSGFQTAGSIGYGALPPSTIAEAIVFALNQPRNISLTNLTLRPSPQPF